MKYFNFESTMKMDTFFLSIHAYIDSLYTLYLHRYLGCVKKFSTGAAGFQCKKLYLFDVTIFHSYLYKYLVYKFKIIFIFMKFLF